MKVRPLIRALFIFSIWAFSPVVLLSEQRELKSETPDKVDAVLLLDASGSMRVTDPNHLREEGAKLFAQFLKPGDRLAVIAFDRNARIVRDLSDYDPAQLPAITQDFVKVGDAGEYTDLSAGIKYAVALLEKSVRADASPVVVLLSDGKMDPAPESGAPNILTQDLLNNFIPELKAKGIKIHTLAFSDSADKDLLQQIAVGSDGSHWFTPDAETVHKSFADLFLVVKKPQMLPLTSKGFRLDASVEEATFYINREEGGELRLRSPGGKVLTAVDAGEQLKWFRGQKFDAVTLIKPEAGDWQVEGLSSSEGFATLLTNLKLVTDWPATLNIGNPALLQARLYEADKPIVLPEMSGTTRFAVQIIPTDKISEPILREIMYDDGTHGDKIARDGIFSYQVDFEEPGEYRLQIVAYAPTFERRQQITFRVKPRVVSLSVIGKSEHATDGHQPVEHAAQADHSEEGSHATEADQHQEKKVISKDLDVQRGEKFHVELSQDAQGFKNIQIKIVAVDKNRKRFVVLATPSGNAFTYGAPTAALPHDGEYDVKAEMTAEKKKGHVSEESNKIRFEKVAPAEGEPEVELVAVAKPVEPESPVLPIALVTLVNIAMAVVCFVLLKKSSGGTKIELPEFAALTDVEEGIQSLEQISALSEIDLKDPRFSEEAVAKLPLRGIVQTEQAAVVSDQQSAEASQLEAEANSEAQVENAESEKADPAATESDAK